MSQPSRDEVRALRLTVGRAVARRIHRVSGAAAAPEDASASILLLREYIRRDEQSLETYLQHAHRFSAEWQKAFAMASSTVSLTAEELEELATRCRLRHLFNRAAVSSAHSAVHVRSPRFRRRHVDHLAVAAASIESNSPEERRVTAVWSHTPHRLAANARLRCMRREPRSSRYLAGGR